MQFLSVEETRCSKATQYFWPWVRINVSSFCLTFSRPPDNDRSRVIQPASPDSQWLHRWS